MKNIYDIVQNFNVHIHSRQINMCLKFEVCNTIISGFDINVAKKEPKIKKTKTKKK